MHSPGTFGTRASLCFHVFSGEAKEADFMRPIPTTNTPKPVLGIARTTISSQAAKTCGSRGTTMLTTHPTRAAGHFVAILLKWEPIGELGDDCLKGVEWHVPHV